MREEEEEVPYIQLQAAPSPGIIYDDE